jgi:plasmid maintenance system antidote protein VapI
MHNPAHLGEILRDWLPEEMTVTQAAKELQVSRVTLSKVLNCKADVTVWLCAFLHGLAYRHNGTYGRLNNNPDQI